MKILNKLIAYLTIIILTLSTSCIKNDVPYPDVTLTIDNIEGEGFIVSNIDYKSNIVTLTLDPTTDIQNVTITNVTYTSGAELSLDLIGTFDMRSTIYVTLSLYADYEWSIVAEQDIPRSFKVVGQIGEEVIDVSNKIATAYVSMDADLSNIEVLELVLGAEGVTTMTPTIEELTYFESVRQVYVTSYGREERWRIYVTPTDVVVNLSKADAWSRVAWLSADGDTSLEYGFRYKESSSEEWIEVGKEEITTNSGTFSTQITGLTPLTQYDFIAYCGEDVSIMYTSTTQSDTPLVNGGFDDWYKPANSWFPYAEGGTEYWGTGNPGSTSLGDSYNLTTPNSEDIRPGSSGEYSANLQSKNVLIKFAAGNLFIGKFIKVAGTNGIVGFGQPFDLRPVALKGWVKYNCGVIDIIGEQPAGVDIVKNETTDIGMIYMALGTWTPEEYGVSSSETEMLGTENTPIIIDTRDKGTFFNPLGSDVIAYGEKVITESIDEWQEFIIPLDYRSTDEIPTHIVIVCSASKYGDYFTGSTQSLMLVDDFELLYE